MRRTDGDSVMTTPAKWGTEFRVNSNIDGDQSSGVVKALADGRFVVVWNDDSGTLGDASGDALHAQIFNADGSKSGAEFLVNTTTMDNQEDATITALADGRFMVAWENKPDN